MLETTIVLAVLAGMILLYTPLSVGQLILLARRPRGHGGAVGHRFHAPGPDGRCCRVVLCTNGQNPQVVEKLIAAIRVYALPVRIHVIKEARDPFTYSAEEIVVPAAYRTPNGSLHKERALQYGIEFLHARGVGEETYLCHLDDDSLVSREYLEHVFSMEEEAGQGVIRLREHGHHLLSTLADLIRVSDCEAWCAYFNRHHRPKAVHGEGLVIRADVEHAIGWDYGTYCGEDFLMGQLIVSRGYRFGHIPHAVSIAPPINGRDFFRQRRRWMYGILWSRDRISRANRRSFWWVLYRYATGWTGFLGLFPLMYGLVEPMHLPLWLVALGGFNLASYFFTYQFGAYLTRRRYMPSVLLLQFVVAVYEGLTLPYALVWKPNRAVFDVIQKV